MPRLAIAVAIEGGGYGASSAAPVARQVMDAWLVGKMPDTPTAETAAAEGAVVVAKPDFANVTGSPDAKAPATTVPTR